MKGVCTFNQLKHKRFQRGIELLCSTCTALPRLYTIIYFYDGGPALARLDRPPSLNVTCFSSLRRPLWGRGRGGGDGGVFDHVRRVMSLAQQLLRVVCEEK